MDKACELINKIQDFDKNIHQLTEVYEHSNSIMDEIVLAATYSEIDLRVCQNLKDYLNGVVQNKLNHCQQLITKKQKQPQDNLVVQTFEQKIAKVLVNTAESTAKRDVQPPIYNMGVTDSQQASEQWAFPRYLDNHKIISTGKGIVPVPIAAKVDNGIAGIDWVSFSIPLSRFHEKYSSLNPLVEDEALTELLESVIDQELFELFGFGLGQKRDKGMHFNKYAYTLQDDLGMVLYGNTQKSIIVQINGSGCALARKGWNEQLYKYLKQIKGSKLSRVDICFDDFEGEYITLDEADQWDTQEMFWVSGRVPDSRHAGNWKRPNGKGRTLYIGVRESGKSCRIYEKGKEKGDALSEWVRIEVEFKASDRYLELEMLLSPSQYFIGAYPVFYEVLLPRLGQYIMPEKTEIIKKQSQIEWKKAIEITKSQFGKYIRQFRKVYDDSELLTMLSSSKDEVPKRLKFSAIAAMQAVRINQPIYEELAHAV
ncbi:replication initiation factor domain-containing protein [Acinetobacter baumannii]|uniref:Replication initiation factor n=9 Tax=Acinetobacter baumannii TaxID=470 RepID=A0A0D5YIV3_ACIBA|nr:replication initiation factor domain-containing protein [Acinetobacter baumannii]AIS06545.1 replication protein [Acinetobacter baumannii]AKA31716.1 replication initiation factor [Acinetobacter baumannii]EHU2543012.1 replication initiation factor domain-containing protein [Acinetobacter baumannii]MCA2111439.1 replication initiation factor domain-containing protein [Acinetobacter baumannii]MDT3365612.1 replication initiation factor domain-containing protein [Acinetobacter baumannii]